MNKEALDVLSHQLITVLAEALPKLSEHWWQKQVLDKLTFQQQGFIRTAQITGLEQLDLAALLRILDQNWHEITVHGAMPVAVRNWVKEAQTLRNRWAHAPIQGMPNEDVYRDLDTIERLAQALGALDRDLEPLRGMKSAVMAALAGNTPAASHPTAPEPSGIFKPGAVVRLKAKPSITGAIIANLPGDPDDRYQVFHDGTVTTYYTSQLETFAASQPSQSPNRREIVALMLEDDTRRGSILIPIVRGWNDAFVGFGDTAPVAYGQSKGRFSGMTPPRKPGPEDRTKAAALLKALGLNIVNRGFDPTLN